MFLRDKTECGVEVAEFILRLLSQSERAACFANISFRINVLSCPVRPVMSRVGQPVQV